MCNLSFSTSKVPGNVINYEFPNTIYLVSNKCQPYWKNSSHTLRVWSLKYATWVCSDQFIFNTAFWIQRHYKAMKFLSINTCSGDNMAVNLKAKENLLLKHKAPNYFVDKYFTFSEYLDIVSTSTLINKHILQKCDVFFPRFGPS